MLKTKKRRYFRSIILILSLFFLTLFHNFKISLANNNYSLEIEDFQFPIEEISENKGFQEDISSIDIELDSSTWNVTDIELNFTNIDYYFREIYTIENTHNNNFRTLKKNNMEGLGVQMKINDTMIIFGVYINIRSLDTHFNDDIDFQLRGYDSQNNAPNSTIYRFVDLNNTIDDGWNYQKFSTPLILHKGNYSLVMSGKIQANGLYDWYYNNSNPNNPGLYRSENTGSGWINGIQGSPFLYKIDQEVRGKNYYPEKFNMTAEIGGEIYKILNVTDSGSGNLIEQNIDFSPNSESFLISINDNKSTKLYFDLNYNIKLKREILADSSVVIKENINEWSIKPQIDRVGWNYTVKFKYPNTWENFSILKNGGILSDLNYINDFSEFVIYILNDTIPEEIIPWEIRANSIKIDPKLKIQKYEYSVDEEILIEIKSSIKGNYTFMLYALGVEKYKNKKSFPSESIIFSYNLTSTAVSGNWTALVYWNNETDAGVQIQEFKILGIPPIIQENGGSGDNGDYKTERIIEPLSGIIISLGVIVGAIGSLSAYQTIKRFKKKREKDMQRLYHKFKDNLSLNYLMISDNKSGLNVYEQFFAGKSMDPSLLSGFLEAIRNFGIELTGSYQKAETVKLDYQNSKILMNESKYFRLILIMSSNPSEEFISSITDLAKEIEVKYGNSLKNFYGGEITMFSAIRGLIEKHLNVTFTYPLLIVEPKGIKLTRTEKLMIQRARSIMKQTNLSYFYVTFLMPDQKYDPIKTKTIFSLIDKGIFKPINFKFKSFKN